MCHGDAARPPVPPGPGPVGEHGPIVLTSTDGSRFRGYHARPAAPADQAVLILPDAVEDLWSEDYTELVALA